MRRWVLAAACLVGCSSGADDGVGGAGTGGTTSVGGAGGASPACPGYEVTPGAGCEYPCEPLVEGGPEGRAYCTVKCVGVDLLCPTGLSCGFADGIHKPGVSADTCLPGHCDPAIATSCPDDFACTEYQFCFPSPGTKGTLCEPHEVESGEPCEAPCTTTVTLSSGRLLCTAQCDPGACIAGTGCLVQSDRVNLCSPPCGSDADCPGTKCNYLKVCDL